MWKSIRALFKRKKDPEESVRYWKQQAFYWKQQYENAKKYIDELRNEVHSYED